MLNAISLKANEMLREYHTKLESCFTSDIIYINGPITPDLCPIIRDVVDYLKNKSDVYDTLYVLLTTNGGDIITVERLVNIFRSNYDEVNFIIPDHAYSAGTILCMSGDNILMDYNSVLGPIDPQVPNKEGRFVPAMGYLEKIDKLLEKATNNTLSEAEFLILKDFDLAELSLYEQARDLTEDLLEKWLAKYKFKNWENHSSTGKHVTEDDKKDRAKSIARELANYERWKSHGRPININTFEKI